MLRIVDGKTLHVQWVETYCCSTLWSLSSSTILRLMTYVCYGVSAACCIIWRGAAHADSPFAARSWKKPAVIATLCSRLVSQQTQSVAVVHIS